MAIWSRAREEFADNRFQLLFIYIDSVYVHGWCIAMCAAMHLYCNLLS